MFKIFLKHWIYEKCIEVAFDGIMNNFSKTPERFKVGDRFKYIEVKIINRYEIYHDVIVEAIFPADTIGLRNNIAIAYKRRRNFIPASNFSPILRELMVLCKIKGKDYVEITDHNSNGGRITIHDSEILDAR